MQTHHVAALTTQKLETATWLFGASCDFYLQAYKVTNMRDCIASLHLLYREFFPFAGLREVLEREKKYSESGLKKRMYSNFFFILCIC